MNGVTVKRKYLEVVENKSGLFSGNMLINPNMNDQTALIPQIGPLSYKLEEGGKGPNRYVWRVEYGTGNGGIGTYYLVLDLIDWMWKMTITSHTEKGLFRYADYLVNDLGLVPEQ